MRMTLHVDFPEVAETYRYALVNEREELIAKSNVLSDCIQASMECGELSMEVKGPGGVYLGSFMAD